MQVDPKVAEKILQGKATKKDLKKIIEFSANEIALWGDFIIICQQQLAKLNK